MRGSSAPLWVVSEMHLSTQRALLTAAGHRSLQQTANREVRYPAVRKAAGYATERGRGMRNRRCPFSGTAPPAADVVDSTEGAKEISCVPGCAATIHLLFPLWLDWLSATFLQECFGCVMQAEHWSLFPITGDIHFGINLSSCVAHSNMCFAGKMTETLQGTGPGFPVPS